MNFVTFIPRNANIIMTIKVPKTGSPKTMVSNYLSTA